LACPGSSLPIPARRRGLFYGSIELWSVVVLVALATTMFALSAYLVVKVEKPAT
jgi:hypothetical protein